MKANELRIGNLINYKSEPCKVVLIGEYGIQKVDEDRIINAKFRTPDLTGIPITKEIMLGCGFIINENWKKDGGYIYFEMVGKIGLFYIISTKTATDGIKYSLGIPLMGNGKHIGTYTPNLRGFKYVHQLQNFWFDLTDEELILKQI